MTDAPVIILVEPQLGENIGAAARAMMNFGVTEMRLVRPRDGWPNNHAINTAKAAAPVLEEAKLFDSTGEAVADLAHVFATTARVRDMVKPVAVPRDLAQTIRRSAPAGERSGILFGPEKWGLSNDDAALSEALVVIPTNPGHASINIAQAVLLVAYEWFQAGAPEALEEVTRKGSQPASQQEILDLFDHLEGELDDCGFLYPPEKRPRMVRNIRNIFTRAGLTDQEVRTLRGIVTGLSAKRKG